MYRLTARGPRPVVSPRHVIACPRAHVLDDLLRTPVPSRPRPMSSGPLTSSWDKVTNPRVPGEHTPTTSHPNTSRTTHASEPLGILPVPTRQHSSGFRRRNRDPRGSASCPRDSVWSFPAAPPIRGSMGAASSYSLTTQNTPFLGPGASGAISCSSFCAPVANSTLLDLQHSAGPTLIMRRD
ncbi:LAQU0S06e01772g1_1 [Lachancea quebecensis]|uniref:LAQU0S06e01772g1_1 n=1 Tax=Lachancea quebecensis TaxID=1654605 RepID=A0A0P1KS25_9SACH|nr:LAQU0S06e01772g1_1 [Lachancea quebecensis]